MNRIKLLSKLAYKDVRHNKKSSIYIILVVAAICLPMLVLVSLRDGYVVLFKEWLEKTSPAKQLGINVKMGSPNNIDNATISKWRADLNLNMVIPHIGRTGFLPTKKGKNIRTDFISTLPENPELKRMGIEKLDTKKNLGIYIPKKNKNELIIDSSNRVKVILDRGGFKKNLYIPVLGYTNDKKNDAYLSLRYMQYYEKWTNGYGINDDTLDVHLPADDSRESALGDIIYDSLEMFKIVSFNPSVMNRLKEEEGIVIEKIKDDNLFKLRLSRPDSQGFSSFDIDALQSRFSGSYDAVIIPIVEKIKVKNLILTPSSRFDPRAQYLIKQGNWINGSHSRLELVIPEELIKDFPLGSQLTEEINGNKITFYISGSHKLTNQDAFMDYETLSRLIQVKNGRAKYDFVGEKFEPNDIIDYNDYPVTTAMVHVNSLEDVLPSYNYFIDNGYDIPQSSISQISHYLEIKTMLTRFVILLTILSGVACMASLFVLMLEIIRRKNSEIGINKVIGINEKFINRMFISQSIFYGLIGLLLSFVLFFIIKIIGSSNQIHKLFNLEIEDGNIFILHPMTIASIFLLILSISLVAGHFSTSATKNIDPADIIVKN